MSSERRIQSSPANGAKSRGPKTPESKARSAANSLRHGLLAKLIVLEAEEAVGSFAELLAAFERDLDPQNEVERAAVETMAVNRCRLLRIWTIEKFTLQIEINKHDPATLDPPALAALAFRTLSGESRSLDLLSRYESRFDRQYARAHNLFLKVRQASLPVDSGQEEICQTNLVPEPDTGIPLPNPAPPAAPDLPKDVPLTPAAMADPADLRPRRRPRLPEPSRPATRAQTAARSPAGNRASRATHRGNTWRKDLDTVFDRTLYSNCNALFRP